MIRDWIRSLFSKRESMGHYRVTGKCSTFGGPWDDGVKRAEGLALLFQWEQVAQNELDEYFLAKPPEKNDTGLARAMNPHSYYVAMRWNYKRTPRKWLLGSMVKITNEDTGVSVMAKPLDWGPAEWTNRTCDVSPAIKKALRLTTDSVVTCEVPLPEEK